MKVHLAGASLAASLLHAVEASAIFPRSQHAAENLANAEILWQRASPQAPDGYTPSDVDCPSDRPTIRRANALSPEEQSWLERRRNKTVQPMKDFLGRLKIQGFDVDQYIDRAANNVSALPNIAIAFSGGGWRALFNGAGAMAAFDDRTEGSTSSGHIGGLLQATTYLTGVSGGNWLVGSLAVNNFTSVQSILNTNQDQSGSLWDFSNSIMKGPDTGTIQILSSADYYTNIYTSVEGKRDADYNTSLTDYWGRALSYYLINATDGGPAYTWSSIADDDGFMNGDTPMPVSVADARDPDELTFNSTSTTLFEFNPFEMGSWDRTVSGFVPLRYVGSQFSGGELYDNESCIAGFDNAGFVMGTSSSLFNQALLQINSTDGSSILQDALTGILGSIGESNNDISDWVNPFYFWNNDTNPHARTRRLTLVDGGEDLQNIGFEPVVQPERNVDVIFAVDSSADTPAGTISPYWPNGTALVATYERFARGDDSVVDTSIAFPAIPDTNTIVNLGLNARPTFFGCNDSAQVNANTPLIVYIPNHPYVYMSNVSTFQMAYNMTERNAIITNGYDVATMGNGTLENDNNWSTCVGCAVLARSLERTGTTVPEVCQQCMSDFCWDGTRDSSEPEPYNPSLALANEETDVTGAGIAVGAKRWSALAVSAMTGLLMTVI